MARPKLPDDLRQTEKIWTRVSKRKKAILKAQAKAGGLSLSDELRRAVGEPPREPPFEITLLAQINGKMGKYGSLANQIAKCLHEGGYPEAAGFEQVKKDVAEIRTMLAKALRFEPC